MMSEWLTAMPQFIAPPPDKCSGAKEFTANYSSNSEHVCKLHRELSRVDAQWRSCLRSDEIDSCQLRFCWRGQKVPC